MFYGIVLYLVYNVFYDKVVCYDFNLRLDFDVKVKVDFNEFFFVWNVFVICFKRIVLYMIWMFFMIL